jgi:hypothetical protein
LSTTAANPAVVSGSIVSKLENPLIYIYGYKNKGKNIISFPKDMTKRTVDTDSINFFEKYSLFKGHLSYASFNNIESFSVLSGSLDNSNNPVIDNKYFVTTDTGNWNTFDNDTNKVNYESFESIFKKAKTPWIVSQPVNKDGLSEYTKVGIQNKCKKTF